jgi:hypothetical protein
MNVEIGTAVATGFLFWEYLFQIFGIGSLQCWAAPVPVVLFKHFSSNFWLKSGQKHRTNLRLANVKRFRSFVK